MDEMYTAFAGVYDEFMDNVPYGQWADFVTTYLKEHGVNDGIGADIGCGSGVATRLLAKQGYDMIGIDSSYEMLQAARTSSEDEILYLNQDMREMELFGTAAFMVSFCDSLNYITEKDELLSVFKLVNNYLDEGGYFIFDLNTPYKYKELLGENTIAETREDKAFIWENYFDEESLINEYCLTLFLKNEDGGYERFEELHYERCYSLLEIKELLREAGMEFIEAFCDYTNEGYDEKNDSCMAERMVIIAREGHQEGKTYI